MSERAPLRNIGTLMIWLWLAPSVGYLLMLAAAGLLRETTLKEHRCRIHIQSVVEKPTTWIIGPKESPGRSAIIRVPPGERAVHVFTVFPAWDTSDIEIKVNRKSAPAKCLPAGELTAILDDAGLTVSDSVKPDDEP